MVGCHSCFKHLIFNSKMQLLLNVQITVELNCDATMIGWCLLEFHFVTGVLSSVCLKDTTWLGLICIGLLCQWIAWYMLCKWKECRRKNFKSLGGSGINECVAWDMKRWATFRELIQLQSGQCTTLCAKSKSLGLRLLDF